ncbi:unnamed protein product [Pseudo-nitzschia multistriata]|uniref:Uncharacterized protein n=1 Tax=Pseudo-nitzschia multistriata TaxID=183589 RepID=A0A448YZA0_9STRA|nr:unnamed protein product [Pseudo-nitzschia multistriata]
MSDARKSPATERNKDVEASGSLLAIEEPFTNKQHIAASNHSTSIPDAVAVGNKLGSTPPESRSSSSVPEALVTLSSNSNVLRVESEPVAVAMAVKYGDNSMSSDDNERKYKYNVKALTCILVVIMVAIAIFLVVFFTFEKKQTKDSLTGDSENITTTSEENNLSAFEYSERRSSLIDILEPIVSDPQVFDPESSQASPDRIDALQWLVTTNLARLSIPVLEQRTSNTNSDLSLEDFPEKTTETAVGQNSKPADSRGSTPLVPWKD